MINNIKKWFYTIRRKLKWYKEILYFKYYIKLMNISETLFSIFRFMCFCISFGYILVASKIVMFSNSNQLTLNLQFCSQYISKTDIIGHQITLTLISVSLIALIASIEKKYIYGEKAISLAFPQKGVFSFKSILLISFAILLLNVFLLLANYALVYVAIVLLIALYIAVYVVYRFAIIFVAQHSLKNKLLWRYYKYNLLHLKKSKPVKPYNSMLLNNLKIISLKYITNNDFDDLNENMHLYFKVLDFTLFNKPKTIQEYYTEFMSCDDIIGAIIDISNKLLQSEQPLYGLKVYNTLLRKLNYHKVIGVNPVVGFQYDIFIKAFSDLNNKVLSQQYIYQLLEMSDHLIEQAYLYKTVDLSYCRLYEHNLIHYHAINDMFEKIYTEIKCANYLTFEDKLGFLENIRSKIIELYILSLRKNNIDCFWQNSTMPENDRIYSLDVIGEPVALYFIKLLENCDNYTLNMYRSLDDGRQNTCFAKILAILSAINILYLNKRKYVYDIDIKYDNAKIIFNKCKLIKLSIPEIKLNEYYNFIIEHYISNDMKYTSGCVYGFNPKFNYKKEVVDTVFAYLFWINQDNADIPTICSEKNLNYNEDVYKIIDDFQ